MEICGSSNYPNHPTKKLTSCSSYSSVTFSNAFEEISKVSNFKYPFQYKLKNSSKWFWNFVYACMRKSIVDDKMFETSCSIDSSYKTYTW